MIQGRFSQLMIITSFPTQPSLKHYKPAILSSQAKQKVVVMPRPNRSQLLKDNIDSLESSLIFSKKTQAVGQSKAYTPFSGDGLSSQVKTQTKKGSLTSKASQFTPAEESHNLNSYLDISLATGKKKIETRQSRN